MAPEYASDTKERRKRMDVDIDEALHKNDNGVRDAFTKAYAEAKRAKDDAAIKASDPDKLLARVIYTIGSGVTGDYQRFIKNVEKVLGDENEG
jgi:hypothetical protein